MRLKGKEALHMYQIGIDIGGTNVKIGLLDEALELTTETSVPFPHTTAADLAKKIRAAVLALLEEKNAAPSARSARSSPAASTRAARRFLTRTIWISTMYPCGSCCRSSSPAFPSILRTTQTARRWPSFIRARSPAAKRAFC